MSVMSGSRKKKFTSAEEYKNVVLLLEPASNKWWEEAVVLVAYSLQRVSARLERLMGTNVIRLTDRKYMRELRVRIEQDYEVQLVKKIAAREYKEVERERNLILEGKTDIIPDNLAEHPIFIVNKKTNEVIAQRRSKLKTNREKNAQRLDKQGAKWERERLHYEAIEQQKDEDLQLHKAQQLKLEETYKKEDHKLGLDLLRIKDQSWKECEMDLKKFLEDERNRNKEKSWRVSTPYIKDSKDIVSIERAKLRISKEAERTADKDDEALAASKTILPNVPSQNTGASESTRKNDASESDDTRQSAKDDSESRQLQYFRDMQDRLEQDVRDGLIMSQVEYAETHYSDPRIVRLKNVTTIKDMYRIAEEIIGEQEDTYDPYALHPEGEEEEEEGGVEEELRMDNE